jgi:hypothetical protein
MEESMLVHVRQGRRALEHYRPDLALRHIFTLTYDVTVT